MGFFLPSILRFIYPTASSLVVAYTLSLSTITIQLRSVPPYIVGALSVLLLGYLGWKTNRRGLYILIIVPTLASGYVIFLAANGGEARYAATFLIALGSFCTGPLSTSWATINTTSDTARAITLSTVILAGNIGGLVATWTYIPALNNPIPRLSQIPGNGLNLAGAIVTWFLAAGLWVYQVRENNAKKRGRDDWRLEGLTDAQAELLGQKHPAYRYLH